MPDEAEAKPGKELTGRKVAIITVSAFAVIIGVNIFMAREAIHTFPGLEVANSYVASQEFDDNRAAQLALGWDVAAKIEDEVLRLDVTGADGSPVLPGRIDATLGRATEVSDDRQLLFDVADTGTLFAQTGTLGPGYWVLRLKMHADDGTLFQQRIELYVTRK